MGFKPFLLIGMVLVLLQDQSCSTGQQRPTAQDSKQTIIKPIDEFELHEVRNGQLITTALLNRRTGKVWIWTKITDAKKNGGPESAFIGRKGYSTADGNCRLSGLAKGTG